MTRTSALRIIVAIITVAAIFVFGATLVHALFFSPSSEIEVPSSSIQATQNIPPKELPDRLIIPKIGVDAHVQHVGIARSGSMAVPTNYTDVAWFKLGTVPGQVGSAVIDGHVDNGLSLAAVFKRLDELAAGDDIYVQTAEGRRLHFKVQEAATYPVADVPLQRLFDRSDAPRLNLITCDGTWMPSKKMYDERHVVYAVLVNG